MGQDQKSLTCKARDNSVSHLARLQNPIDGGGCAIRQSIRHAGADRLRTQHGDGDSPVAIRDREPLGEAHRRMLGHRIRRRADLAEQASRRRGLQQISTSALKHGRKDGPRGVDVGQHVDPPNFFPLIVAETGPTGHEQTGVGAKQIDRAHLRFRRVNDTRNLGAVRHIRHDRDAADFGRDGPGAIGIDVNHDDTPGALGRESPGERPPDPAGSAGDDGDRILDAHALVYEMSYPALRGACHATSMVGAHAQNGPITHPGENMSSAIPPQIQCELEALPSGGQLARVTVDHQARVNTLNSALILQLVAVCERLQANDTLRCVVLTGAGDRAFIGGADIREMADLDPASARAFISRLHQACASIRALPVPVIARIQGFCLGAGLEIAASCDLRVAADGATFGMPEVNVGIPSVIEAALLPRLVGAGMARELVYTGRSLTATDAESCRLVDRVVSSSDLDVATLDWVRAIDRAGPHAIRLQKQLVRLWDSVPLDEAIERSVQVFADAYQTDEPRRLMQAFLERK